MNLLNIIDLEATCWEDQPPPGQVSEIIEIGVCVLNLETLERSQGRSLLIRPTRSEVSEFCTRLTGHSAQTLAAGMTLAEACTLLRREYQADSRSWASWGDYDRKMLRAQCEHFGVPYPLSRRHTNAKKAFTEGYVLKKRPGMAQALSRLGLPLEGRHHSGADDAWNIAGIVARLLTDHPAARKVLEP